jgi:hypothetical protein
MISIKTAYGSIEGSADRGIVYIVFAKEFKSIVLKEDDIVMDILDRGYDILDNTLYYVGGEIKKGCKTYVNMGSHKYITEPYEYIEHGIWKLKFKLKKNKKWLH